MEAYKSTCPSCKKVYYWTGYKTGLFKTKEQLEAMLRRENICEYCKQPGLQTEVDRETENGKLFGAGEEMIIDIIKQMIKGPAED